VIQLVGPTTTALLQGQWVQAIAAKPRRVEGASMVATKSNENRRELTRLQFESWNADELIMWNALS